MQGTFGIMAIPYFLVWASNKEVCFLTLQGVQPSISCDQTKIKKS